MPFCPECNTDYKDEVMTCPECQEDLIPCLAPTQVPESVDWCVVESVSNEVAGLILQSVLEDEGIEVFLRSHEMPAYAGIKGNVGKSEWGDILVPTYNVQFAQECIKDYYDSLKED
jgi:hypothetical protein